MGGVILSCSLQAQAITKPCDGCSADQMYEMAFDSLSEMRIHGPLYVADLRRGMVRKYEYRNNIGSGWSPGNEVEEWAEETAVESNISAGVSEVGGLIRAASSTERIVIPPNTLGMPEDVFEAIRQSSFDDDIAYWINLKTTADFFNRASDALQAISGTWFNPGSLRVHVQVQWSNGSSALYKWDSTLKTWVRVENTARDGRGNLIPESKGQVDGKQYNFPNAAETGSPAADDFYDMLRHFQGLGIQIVDGRGGLGGYGYFMTCTPSACHIYILPQ